MVDNYDALTVEDAKDLVREGEVTATAMLDHELEHKDRVTLTEWLDTKIEPNEPKASTTVIENPERENVRVANQRTGSIAGMHFEENHQTRVVERNPRIDEAIEKGDLRELVL